MVGCANLLNEVKMRNISQKQIAQVLEADQGNVSRKLNGKLGWTLKEALIIANYIGKPVEELFKNE